MMLRRPGAALALFVSDSCDVCQQAGRFSCKRGSLQVKEWQPEV